MSAFELILTWTFFGAEGQKRRKSNQAPSTQSVLQNMNSTAQNEVPQNSRYIHGGIIAFILLGCIIFMILVGICVIVRFLRKRKSEEYALKWEKKFEESSFETLDREMDKPVTERRVAKKDKRSNVNLILKCEQETVV